MRASPYEKDELDEPSELELHRPSTSVLHTLMEGVKEDVDTGSGDSRSGSGSRSIGPNINRMGVNRRITAKNTRILTPNILAATSATRPNIRSAIQIPIPMTVVTAPITVITTFWIKNPSMSKTMLA